MPIYKVEGSLKTTTEEISFSVQIDAKTGKVLGFRRERLADRFSLG